MTRLRNGSAAPRSGAISDRFARDGQLLGLAAYPIVDAETGADTDPYPSASRTRYPSWAKARHLADVGSLLDTIAAPLPASV